MSLLARTSDEVLHELITNAIGNIKADIIDFYLYIYR